MAEAELGSLGATHRASRQFVLRNRLLSIGLTLGRVQRIAQLYVGKCALELGMRELYVGLPRSFPDLRNETAQGAPAARRPRVLRRVRLWPEGIAPVVPKCSTRIASSAPGRLR